MKRSTMKKAFAIAIAVAIVGGVSGASYAVEFYEWPDEEESVEVIYPDGSGPLWPESNLIQGPGIGFDEDAPHDELAPPGGSEGFDWVTLADCGFPADYVECVGEPIIRLDLGADVPLDEMSVWEYSSTNANGARAFTLRFATDADGPDGHGTSIDFAPELEIEDYFDFAFEERRSLEFGQVVNARYVEVTLTDNWFDDPGDGTGENGWGAGGDRVGLGEIAFRIPDVDVDPLAPLDNGTLTGAQERSDYVREVLGTWVGDSNLDGEFGSADFVAVFTAGQYEDGIDGNSTWVTGDWNGDGDFDSSDFVTAFSGGGFEQGPLAATAAVPEPSGLLLLLSGAMLTLRRRK